MQSKRKKGKTKISSALDSSTNSGILYVNGGADVLENITLKVADLSINGLRAVGISAEKTKNCKLIIDNVDIDVKRYGVHSRANSGLAVEITGSNIAGYGAYYSRGSKSENVSVKKSELKGTAFYNGDTNSFATISVQYGDDAGASENVSITIEDSIINAGTDSDQSEHPFSIVGFGKGFENKNTVIIIKNTDLIKDGNTLTSENYADAFLITDKTETEEASVTGLKIEIDGKAITPEINSAYQEPINEFTEIKKSKLNGKLNE